jgi:hypothetical protein
MVLFGVPIADPIALVDMPASRIDATISCRWSRCNRAA